MRASLPNCHINIALMRQQINSHILGGQTSNLSGTLSNQSTNLVQTRKILIAGEYLADVFASEGLPGSIKR